MRQLIPTDSGKGTSKAALKMDRKHPKSIRRPSLHEAGVELGQARRMAKPLVTDEPYGVVRPLLPLEPTEPKGRWLQVDNRLVSTCVLFVLKSGIFEEVLPRECAAAPA